MATCPLCRQQDGVQVYAASSKDHAEVICPRCGEYFYDQVDPPDLDGKFKDVRHVISGVIRSRTDRGDKSTDLRRTTVDDLIAGAPVPQTASEYIDRLLLYLAARVDRPWSKLVFEKERNYPLLFMKGPDDMNGFTLLAKDLGYLEPRPGGEWRFTPAGWERVERLRDAQPRSHQAFVAMWFDPTLDDAWTNGLTPGVEDSGYFKAVRSDRAQYLGKVDDWIIAQIRLSGLVVADFTGNRGGVYYEAGFAMALGIPVVFTCREDHMKDVHFDTNHFPHIVWSQPADLRTKLNDRIVGAVLPTVGRGTTP